MFFAAILGVTLVPVLMTWLIRGKITPEIKNPLNRFLIWLYQPFVNFVLRFRWLTIFLSLLVLGLTAAAGPTVASPVVGAVTSPTAATSSCFDPRLCPKHHGANCRTTR